MPFKPTPKRKPWQEERVVHGRRLHDNSKFYNSRKWRNTSKAYRVEHPLCECDHCKKNEFVKPSEVVDHVRGLQFLIDNNLNPYDWNELKAMSRKCHDKKSGRDAHKNKIK
jgi:5-methylcytosine-specific restriction protein A